MGSRGRVRAVFRYSLWGVLGGGVSSSALASNCFDPLFGKPGDVHRRVMKRIVDQLPPEHQKFFVALDPNDAVDRYTLELYQRGPIEIDEALPMDVSKAASQILEHVLPEHAPQIPDVPRLPLNEKQLWSRVHPSVRAKLKLAGFESDHPEWIRAFAGLNPHTPEGYQRLRELKVVAERSPARNKSLLAEIGHLLEAFSPEAPTERDFMALQKYLAARHSYEHIHPELINDLVDVPLALHSRFWNLDPTVLEDWEKLNQLAKDKDIKVALVADAMVRRLKREGHVPRVEILAQQLGRLEGREKALAQLNPTVRQALQKRPELTADELFWFKGVDPETDAGVKRLEEIHAEVLRDILMSKKEKPGAGGEIGARLKRLEMVQGEIVGLLKSSSLMKKRGLVKNRDPISGSADSEAIDKLSGQVAAKVRAEQRLEAWRAALDRVPPEYRATFEMFNPNHPSDIDELRRRSIDTRLGRVVRNIARDLVESLPGVDEKKVAEIRQQVAYQTLLDEHHRTVLQPFPEAMRPYLADLDDHQLTLFRGLDAGRAEDRVKLADWAEREDVGPLVREACQRMLMFIPRASAK